MAGVGNVFKNEVLFLEKINPATPVGALTDEQIDSLIERARRLLVANASRSGRTTTGLPGSGWAQLGLWPGRSSLPAVPSGDPEADDRTAAPGHLLVPGLPAGAIQPCAPRGCDALACGTMAASLTIRPGHPDFLDLPWEIPLEEWDLPNLLDLPKGISRHEVRFLSYPAGIYVVKELAAAPARNDYAVLETTRIGRAPRRWPRSVWSSTGPSIPPRRPRRH